MPRAMGKDYADMEIRTPGSAMEIRIACEIEAAASLFDDPLDPRAVAASFRVTPTTC